MPVGTPFHASTPKSIAYICVELLILMHVAISPLFLNLVAITKIAQFSYSHYATNSLFINVLYMSR